MTERTFRSANYFDREIDLSAPTSTGPTGTPAGIIGTANRGPAFIPVTVANFDEFSNVFGNLDQKHYGPYAANEFLKHKNALTYMRVLGAGANSTSAQILSTQANGRVTSAGFKLEGPAAAHDTVGRHNGVVQFLAAAHTLRAEQDAGNPQFTDNDSFVGGSTVNVLRGMVLLASGARMMVLDGTQSAVGAFTATGPDDGATIASGKFKLIISSTLGNSYFNHDGNAGVRIFTASLDPSNGDYYAKILNRDPDKFVTEQHLLYADFPVDDEMATATVVAVLSGTAGTSTTSGDTTTPFRNLFGGFDTRYQSPSTTWFISQPFGDVEYDLFKFEAIDDGEYANTLYKISVVNLKASVDESDPYGTFDVQVRSWDDSDTSPNVLEQYNNCSLNPTADNYVAKRVGDRKVFYNFDAVEDSERRVIASGKYPNASSRVRIVMSDAVERMLVPQKTLPFGFRGHNLLKTTDTLTDSTTGIRARVSGILAGTSLALSGAILPPIPMQYKVTRGERDGSAWMGEPGASELATSQLYWGVKFERATDPLDPNTVGERNTLLENYAKFLGIQKLDTLVTGSGADTFNNNKFSLAKVALTVTSLSNLTASINEHMKEAAYVRNARLDASNYTIYDSGYGANRYTFATLLAKGTAAQFNRFSPYTKFTNFMAGGYDGLNILDRDNRRMNDKSTSFDDRGGAEANYVSPGFLSNLNGSGQSNSNVQSYVTAINVMTDPMQVNHNLLVIPGIREVFLTDYAMDKCREYGLAYYVVDVPSYDDDNSRLYDDDTTKPAVDKTASSLETRGIDNNYAGVYWPDVVIEDTTNRRRVAVPASIAAVGAIAFNDKVRYPWFAPAGFNRASLDFVKNVKVRLSVPDRDRLQDARINPIATFPKLGFVVWGQKTLQLNRSSLDRVNVRRMLLEVKRIIINIAKRTVFEQNTPALRADFVAKANLQLGLIQAQEGIEGFRVIMNETNNTREDINLNRLNGRIIVNPTRTIEYIAVDFIITADGVQFLA